ncbi:MAG TPA: phosphatase PAP2 family protein [Daejeonella sp.]|nr:phosphatase PAP2 family protein [Daejeonella sp.]
MIEWLKTIDEQLLIAINRHHSTACDHLMWFASGDKSWLGLYAFLLLLLIIQFKKQSWWLIVLIIPLIAVSDQLASSVLKPWVMRLRPSHEPALQNMLHYVNNYRGGTYGFVSSHSFNVFSIASYLSLTAMAKIKWIPWVLFPWALFVSCSRVYLGVHYPLDVLVPMILGILNGIGFAMIYHRFKPNFYTSKS